MHHPNFEQFQQLAAGHTLVPIYRQVVADGLTPVSALAKLREGGSSFIFESVVGGEQIGRWSFVGAGPFARFEAYGNRVREQVGDGPWTETTHADPMRLLEERLKQFRAADVQGLPPFCGGAVGHLGYDTIRYVEELPNAPTDDRHLPDMSFAFHDSIVVFDHIHKTLFIIVHAHLDVENLRQCYDTACEKIDAIIAQLERPTTTLPILDVHVDKEQNAPPAERFESNMGRDGYMNAVRKAIEYINAGDIFQVVPSQRFRTQTHAKGFDIYRALRIINPSPFMFYLEHEDFTLLGASPEIMCRVVDNQMTVRPLAGTRPRGSTKDEDNRLADELLADPKERAEHIMLVDLARNDVGRVAELGSVEIDELLMVERYSHVMHISSSVTGTLAKGKSAFDAIRSALPTGTLSGAPKIRAMEIIDELEPHRRGPYGGAVGYIDFTGNTDTCIALRTMILTGSTADVQAGAGIVADSDPAAEYQETVNKAMSLLRAIELAERDLT